MGGRGRTLATAITNLNLDPGKVTAMLREGDPKDVVVQVADEVDASLIIMGSRGLQGLKAILENSVSQYVFQLASRPMLLVKDDLYTIRPIKRVMVAMDKSDSAKEGLNIAISLLRDVKGVNSPWCTRSLASKPSPSMSPVPTPIKTRFCWPPPMRRSAMAFPTNWWPQKVSQGSGFANWPKSGTSI